jgi:hypothetical protein
MAEIGRICTVCTHDERRAINAALVGREPYRNIAKRFGGFSPAALTRHTKNCMPRIVEAGLDAMDQRGSAKRRRRPSTPCASCAP